MSGEAQGQGDATQQLRAWVDYLRDLGIYDLYRCGDPVADAAVAAGAIKADAAEPVIDALPYQRAGRAIAHEAVEAGVAPLEQRVPITSAPPDERSFLEAPQMPLVSFNNLAPLPTVKIAASERATALVAIQQEIGDCTRCPLAYAGRRKIVFGDGSPMARLMFVGEGPGADEDAQGIPFVGKAGQLLNNMIAAMGLAREQVYIANIVKCRPPANRVPEPVEANTCSQFLLRQIDVVQPEVIVALGATAAMYLLGVKQSLSSLRGRWHSCRGAKLVVTYHPAFLLRDPRQKAEAWKDLQMVMADLGLKAPKKSQS
jgi:uracil-DNA glycosylase family 4